jgi:hypothetical protein
MFISSARANLIGQKPGSGHLIGCIPIFEQLSKGCELQLYCLLLSRAFKSFALANGLGPGLVEAKAAHSDSLARLTLETSFRGLCRV